MNRLFDPEQIIDLEPKEISTAPLPHGRQAPAPRPRPMRSTSTVPRSPSSRASSRGTPTTTHRAQLLTRFSAFMAQDREVLLVAGLAGLSLVAALCSVLFLNHSWKVQENLREERNLLLVERLRSLGPASSASQPVLTPPLTSASTLAGIAPGSDLPPPPPDEPWMQQLGSLPQGSADRAPVLRVPVSPLLNAAAPAASREGRAAYGGTSGPAPQLVGLVAAQGRQGSAIFQVGGSSANVGVGESIGSSGWRLQAADGDSAVIERNGEVRRISLTTSP